MEEEFTEALGELLMTEGDGEMGVRSVRSFREAGLMSSNNGLVVRLEDGSEFQITVVQAR